MIKANNEKELLNILKVFAQESVKKARYSLNESNDPAQDKYLENLKFAQNKYEINLDEQDGDDTEQQSNYESEENNYESEEREITDSETLSAEEVNSKSFETSFDSIVKNINSLRAGRSTKDKEIKEELTSYYDRLSEDERKILHIFLKQLANILQGAIEGEDAVDPSDPPLNAKVEFPGEDGEKQQQQDAPVKKKPAKPSAGQEDTSPPLPIKPGEKQDLNEIRTKVQRLMKRF